MIKNIVVKEILESVKEPKFVYSWLLLIIAVMTSVFLMSQDYNIKKENYEAIERSRQEFTSNYGNPNRFNTVMYSIRPLQHSQIYFKGVATSEKRSSFHADHVKALLPPVDLITIFSLLLPLLVIVLTYNSISGEKENGTLKLMHSLGLSRTALVSGKLLGNFIIISVPFLFVFLLGIFSGVILTGEMPDADTWLSYAIIALVSLVYLLFFIALSLFVSASVKSSGTSVLILLCLWTLFTMVIPNLSPLISSQLRPLPSVNLTNIEYINILNEERDALIQESRKRITGETVKKYLLPGSITDLSNKENLERFTIDKEVLEKAVAEFGERSGAEEAAIREAQTQKANRLKGEFQLKVRAQSDLATNISLSSPTSSFTYLVTAMAALDENSQRHFREAAGKYQDHLWEYLEAKIELEEQETGKEIEWDKFMDLSDHPRFAYRPDSLSSRFYESIFFMGHLAIFALITMLIAVIRYLKYDVR